MDKLTNTQLAQIYCIKNGHAKFITNCFGYVNCGRCGSQIGDSLGGVFSGEGYALVGHNCDECDKVFKTLSDMDKLIFHRLEKDLDTEDSLKDISFD